MYKIKNKAQDLSRTTGQGTIEYLVIIAIVVVLSLVVVSLLSNQLNTAGTISYSTSELKNRTGINGISIVDATADGQGNGTIFLKNLNSDTLIITKIKIDGEEHPLEENSFVFGNTFGFNLTDIAVCDQTNKIYSIIIYFTNSSSEYELEKPSNFETITFTCADTINTNLPTIEEKIVCKNELEFQNGEGTTENPYGICSWTHLNNVRNHLEDNYKLLRDITAQDTDYIGIGDTWSPMGPFNGSLNGNNKTISDISIFMSGYNQGAGLFNTLNGNVTDLTLNNVNIYTTSFGRIGAIASTQNGGTISNCFADVNILATSGAGFAGALVGVQETATIINSHSSGTINVLSSGFGIGGLIGATMNGQIINSYSNTNVTGVQSTGGLVGSCGSASFGPSSIINSYSTGNVSGTTSVGGLLGVIITGTINFQPTPNSLILNSYSTGNVTGTSRVGGLVGESWNLPSEIVNSYSTGSVSSSGSPVGGLFGENAPGTTITNSAWWSASGPTTAVGNPSGGITYSVANKSDFYLQTHEVYTTGQNTWTFGTDKNWIIQSNNYPKLSWQ